jgi:hypothetical protein
VYQDPVDLVVVLLDLIHHSLDHREMYFLQLHHCFLRQLQVKEMLEAIVNPQHLEQVEEVVGQDL